MGMKKSSGNTVKKFNRLSIYRTEYALTNQERMPDMQEKFVDLINHQNDIDSYNERKQKIIRRRLLKDSEIKIGSKKMILSNANPTEPVIKVNKEGEVIQQLEITCRCGEKIFVNFKYK
jgi:hypothetical protein